MQIRLEDAGKRFNRDWIFRSFDFEFSKETAYAIVGNNGSGKSTLLLSIAGATELSKGKNLWQHSKEASPVPGEEIHRHFAIVAPYLELIEEMTAAEFLQFHASFKPFISALSIKEILDLVQLSTAANKQIRYFSSGMKQRLKLAQAIFADVPVLLLDEPCTNLDQAGYELYHSLIHRFCSQKLIIVSSNDKEEHSFCTEKIDIRDYKK